MNCINLFQLLLLIPFCASAQIPNKGIQFEERLSWYQVKQKAKAENRYIFMDCMATWCAPCKMMDKEVYPNAQLGELINSNFVSVKVQMDKTDKDNDQVKARYADAEQIMKAYKVTAFPTMLFFNPSGKLVHQAIGGLNAEQLMMSSKDATDPTKQYYTLLNKYRQGKKDYSKMVYMAGLAESFKDKTLAAEIGRDYINNYLMKLPSASIYTKDNLLFIGKYVTNRDRKAFALFYPDGSKVDQFFLTVDSNYYKYNPYSPFIVDKVIIRDIINPKRFKQGTEEFLAIEPDWKQLSAVIAKKYGAKYVSMPIYWAKMHWYQRHGNFDVATKIYFDDLEATHKDTSAAGRGSINQWSWDFIFSNPAISDSSIQRAIKKMEQVVKVEPIAMYIDTYANLLYRTGKVEEAIGWEEKAVKAAREVATVTNQPVDTTFQTALDKMRKAEPTWKVSSTTN